MDQLEKVKRDLHFEEVKRDNAMIIDKVMSRGVDGKPVTHEPLGSKCGLSHWTIKKYISAENKPEAAVLRELYAMTGNPEMFKIISGDRPVMVLGTPEPVSGGFEALQKILEAQGQSLGVIKLATEIVQDGKIDHLDRAQVEQMKEDLPHAVNALIQLVHGIDAEYQKNKHKQM